MLYSALKAPSYPRKLYPPTKLQRSLLYTVSMEQELCGFHISLHTCCVGPEGEREQRVLTDGWHAPVE